MKQTRGASLSARLDSIGISRSEFGERAGIDRGTIARALGDDPKVTERTWGKLESTMTHLEDELGMAESGHVVTATIEYGGATITMQGSPDDVAEAARKVLDHD